jgi:hypothetical protein
MQTLRILAIAVATLAPGTLLAQTKPAPPDPLSQTIAAMDKVLFDAYNTCDLDKLSTLVSDDLEFYHDKTGLAVGKQPFLDSIKKYICGKVHRELVKSSLEVYPLAGYGAVEIGTHRFTHPNNPAEGVGEARFITLWQKKDGAWRVTRVISYDHAAPSTPTAASR